MGNAMVLFSLFLTSKRDTTLFLNKPFFCDKWLRLWFYITAIQIIYTSKEVYSQQAEECLKLCINRADVELNVSLGVYDMSKTAN